MTSLKSLGLTTAAFALSATAVLASPPVNQTAPGFSSVDTTGIERILTDFADETVILEWTNHDCPYVRKHYVSGNMQGLQAEAAEDGVVWLQIISSAPGKQGHVSAEQAIELNEERGATVTATLLDETGEIGRLYDARTTPHMYVIENGTLVYKGGIDDKPSANPKSLNGANNYVRAALTSISAGQPIEDAETRSYGCTVKYGS
ncbi:MAG: redoxin domain-containing protein [Pseudomonadota bacterium]